MSRPSSLRRALTVLASAALLAGGLLAGPAPVGVSADIAPYDCHTGLGGVALHLGAKSLFGATTEDATATLQNFYPCWSTSAGRQPTAGGAYFQLDSGANNINSATFKSTTAYNSVNSSGNLVLTLTIYYWAAAQNGTCGSPPSHNVTGAVFGAFGPGTMKITVTLTRSPGGVNSSNLTVSGGCMGSGGPKVLGINFFDLQQAFGSLSGWAIAPPPPPSTIPFLAGRPLAGNYVNAYGTGCQGTFYGKVNGQLVIFTAGHCQLDTNKIPYPEGTPALRNDETLLGLWGNAKGQPYDLSYITLTAAMSPTSGLNRVYGGGTDGGFFWTITHQPTIGCDNVSAAFGGYIYNIYHEDDRSTNSWATGTLVGFANVWPDSRCNVWTTIPWPGPNSRVSGSSFILQSDTGTVFGVGSVHDPRPGTTDDDIITTPIKGGLAAIGGQMCVTSTCN